MPLRKSSTSLGITSNSTTLKPHRSYDSNRIWNQPLPPTSGTSQTNCIFALVNRLKNKVPCNSGLPLDRVEADKPTRQAVETLISLSQDSIDVIAWALADILYGTTKKQLDTNGFPSLEVLQTQLFILKVLSAALASRWDLRTTEDAANSGPNMRDHQNGSSHAIPSLINSEVPPLNDQCAKYILAVMVLFLRQTPSIDSPTMTATRYTDIAFRDYESDLQMSMPSPDEDISYISSRINVTSLPILDRHYEKTSLSITKLPASLVHLVSEYAGRIVFHVSASNWGLVLERIREKIRQDDDNLDLSPIHLLAYSAVNRQRLVQVLNELSSLLINMGKEAQKAVAVALRAAIWRWIDYFPAEFNDAIRVRGRTEGAPERVFDLFHSLNPSGNERVFWPTLTTLCCITSERISAEFVHPYDTKPTRKDYRFGVEVLKHLGSFSKHTETALVCAVDICRAAVYIHPEEEAPLRLLAYDVVHEIKSMLSYAPYRKAYNETHDDIDIPFYSEILVAVYRFLRPEDSLPLFQHCLQAEKSDATKTIAVRACLTLVQEAARIPWQRPLDELEGGTTKRLRDIFTNGILCRHEVDEYGNRKSQETRPKSQQVVASNLTDRETLLLGILALWRAEPQFCFVGMGKADFDTRKDMVIKMWEAKLDISVKISSASCHNVMTASVLQTPPGHPLLDGFIDIMKDILPITLMSVANNLINCRADSENQRLWISAAYQTLEQYAWKNDYPHVKEIQNDPGRLPAFAMTEIALVISLTSAESSVSQLSARTLRLLATVERQPGFPNSTSLADAQHRLAIYDRLGDPKIMVIGRVGHQKRIRKLVRSIAFLPDVHTAIWSECFRRWRGLTEFIYETMNDFSTSLDGRRGSFTPNPLQESRFQWQNLTLFLAALSGSNTGELIGRAKLTAFIPRLYMPDSIRVMDDPVPLIDAFLSDLTDLLVAPDAQVRDTARDALGAELGPKLYGKVLKYLEEALRSMERNTYEESIQSLLPKLDQFIAVLKLLLENSHAKAEEGPAVDIGPALYLLASLISRFPGFEACRTKTKFCAMCEVACDSHESVELRKDTNNRHLILDIIMEWVQPTNEGDQITFQSDVNMACLRTAVKLLEQLQLQPAEGESAGEDNAHVVSRLFNRYSGALLHGLDTYYNDDMANDDGSDTMPGYAIYYNPRAFQKEAHIRELVITGLTHLVSANPDSGLRQCLSLAYDKDKKKRAIFAHVFTRVIKQGIKFDFTSKIELQAKRSSLCDLVRNSDMVLALIICEICPPAEVDIIISVLLNLFDNRTSLMKLMAMMIDQEIEHTDNDANLFRGNSTCTRFLSAFARIHGYSYLRSLIQPLVKSMLSMPPGCSYELDPSKAGDQDLEQNRKNVEFIASSFLAIISASVPTLPAMFREICAHITSKVAEHWPDSKYPALGSFIFLRFISPAVVTPENVEVELPKDENTVVVRRGLMVIAKILQNLANNIFFGKEAYMVILNKFLEGNIANVTRFLSEIIKNAEPYEDNDQWLGNAVDDTDDIVLHRFFVKHADKIGRELLSRSKPSQDGVVDPSNGKRAWDELCTLLVDLKSPFEAPSPSTVMADSHEGYKQLMARYARRDTQSVQSFFIETDLSSPEPAFFVLHLSRIDVESLDIELLMYHIFKTLSTYGDRQFELILDCTAFTTASEIPLQWINYCAELIPMDIRARLNKTHILNPDSQAQKYLRRLYNVAAGISFCGEVRTYPTVKLLQQQVPGQALVPLAYAESLEAEPRQIFHDVMMKVGYMRMPVTLEVGASHLRITSVGKTSISHGLLCNSTEVIPLMDVSDIYNVSTGQDLNEFIIRRSRQAMTMYFASSARDAIVKAIRSAKGRLKEPFVRTPERYSRNLNVPAVLLHIAFLSFDYNDDQLRGAAYDLLGAVCSYLKLEKNPINSCNTGFVPGNYSAFVEQLSERLAEAIPMLTLDFLCEVSKSMNTSGHIGTAERTHCLTYIRPWIKKLSLFANATSSLYERSGARLRDCIRTLAQLSISYPEIGPFIHKCIWNEVAKLDNFILDVILDELVRMAVDGGIGSSRCEAVANILACLSSIGVRAKIYSRLRKTLGKVSPKPSITLVEHTHWSEISTLLRLALSVSPQSKHLSHNQFHIPEIIHLTTLIAGVGQTSVRKTTYGIDMSLLQSVYMSRSDDIPAEELLQLMKDCTTPAKLKLFGLLRDTPSSEYGIIDPSGDKDFLDTLEKLTELLARVMELTSGSTGLLNVWRARWMSLVTSTAFQLSPAIQIRSFIAMGILANNDVDDDMLYQLLVALRNALYKANESQTLPIVSMLRCLCKMVPVLPQESRYLVQLFWLAVALLQSSHVAFFDEASCLLSVSLKKMESEGLFEATPVNDVLLEGRRPLIDVTSQLDDMLKLSFETSFSFSLAAIIFKGLRHSGLRDSAEAALRSLLRVTIRSRAADQENTFRDVLGYFLALLPLSTSSAAYGRLLEKCEVEDTWPPQEAPDDEEDNRVPRVNIALLSVTDASKALLITSFVGAMLMTAQGDDAETESLYALLCDIAVTYPDIVALIYDNLQDKIKDTFANSSNPSIIKSVSNIYSIALQEKSRSGLRDSNSTLGIPSEDNWRRRQANALEELGMLGLANSFTFLPRDRGHATKMINWIPALIERIIN